jgi:hypothetical protein
MADDDDELYTSDFRLEEAFDALKRYGGEPDSRVLELIEMVAKRLNDDIYHFRKLGPTLAEIRAKLDEIEKEPDLA